MSQVARARGAHFARPDKPPAPGTARAGAAARGADSGSGGTGRRRGAAADAAAAGEGGDAPKELWPGPFAEARRVRFAVLLLLLLVYWVGVMLGFAFGGGS